MIERFTTEEIEIIKKELGIASKTSGSKKSILCKEESRLNSALRDKARKYGAYRVRDAWDAIMLLCDLALGNYILRVAKRSKNDEKQFVRYVSIFDEDTYKEMVNEIIDVIVKYDRKGEKE